MVFPTLITWTNPFPFKGMLGCIFHFIQILIERSVASDFGLYCLPMSHKKDAGLIWVKEFRKDNKTIVYYGQAWRKRRVPGFR